MLKGQRWMCFMEPNRCCQPLIQRFFWLHTETTSTSNAVSFGVSWLRNSADRCKKRGTDRRVVCLLQQMNTKLNVTLQINLAPSDWLHARYTLPHHLRQFAHQVDEVLLVFDLHRSTGRFAEGWEERLPKIRQLIQDCCSQYSHARVEEVNYASDVVANVSAMFLGSPCPTKRLSGRSVLLVFLWAICCNAPLYPAFGF